MSEYISTNYDTVIEYVKNGLSLFPCHTIEDNGKCSCGNASCNSIAKHPLTEHGALNATRDRDVLRQYFTGVYANANIAVATGIPSGVIVLDVDDISALASLLGQSNALPSTWTVETGSGGRHYYFRFDDRCRSLKNAVKFHGALDVRTTGGYVIAPPSLHANGKRYRWLVSPSDVAIASVPDWLYDITPKHDDTSTSTPTSPSPSHVLRRAKTETERLTLYLERCSPAISGERGHDVTYRLCCYIVSSFGLSNDDVISAMSAWNTRCSPSWTESELRHKLDDARKTIDNPKENEEANDVGTGDIGVDAHEHADASFPTLHADAYVGLLGDIVKANEPQTEASNAGVLLSLMTAFGNAVGKRPAFHVGSEAHHVNLFTCLVGDTASGKGVSWGVVRRLMRKTASDWLEQCLCYGMDADDDDWVADLMEGGVERLERRRQRREAEQAAASA